MSWPSCVVAWLLDLVQGFRFFGDHFLRKLRVGKCLGGILSVGQHPFDETLDSVAFGTVGKLGRYEQPRETRNGVRSLPWSISDRDPEIVGHTLRSPGSCCRHAGEIRLDKLSRGILDLAIRHFVLYRVDELNVTKSVWRLFDQTSNTLVALAAEAHGPVHRGALAHFVFPFIADLGQIIRPDIRCAAAVRAVYHHNIVCGKAHTL